MKKRILSFALVLCVVLTLLPMSTFAEDTATSGTCGDNLTWTLDGDGTLTISGTGKMYDYDYNTYPWYSSKNDIKAADIKSGVTSIGNYAFWNCGSLASVTIGDSVKNIGDSAFRLCSGLTSVSIPDSVTSIESYAFSGCSSLANLTIGKSVTSIGDEAFYGCLKLTNVTIPDSVTSIGSYAFAGCSGLSGINVSENNENYASEDGVLFNKNKTELIQYPAAKTGSQYVVADSVTSIGSNAFYDCIKLTSVAIGDNVTSIGDHTFQNCSSLKDVYYSGTEAQWSEISVGDYNEELLNATMHYESVPVHTHDYTAKVTAPTCTEQGYTTYTCVCGDSYVDNYTDALGHDYVNGQCTRCEEWSEDIVANGTCGTNLTWTLDSEGTLTISGTGGMTSSPWRDNYGEQIKKVVIENGVTSIGNTAFASCSNITSITIGDSVKSIGRYAFVGCSGLSSINVSENNENYASENGVLFNKNKTALIQHPAAKTETEYEIPYSVTGIGDFAFKDCSSLTSVTIPDSVTSIGYASFCDCTSLTSVVIPDSVTGIGEYAFCRCLKLTNITILDSVTSIGDGAFVGCTSLTSVTVPDSVTSIGGEAFRGCNSLTDVYYSGSEAQWNQISFDWGNDCLTNATIHYESVPVHTHDYTTAVTAPTCTEQGYTTYTCACGDSYVVYNTDTLGHDYGEWITTVAPSCTTSGVEVRFCSNCDAYEMQEVAALGHDYVRHNAKAPTCTEAGWESYDTCSRCDYTTYKEIPATGHSYTTAVTAPTCTDKGYTTYTCTCGDSYSVDYVEALGHSYGEPEFKWDGDTCEATFACSACKDVQTLDCTVKIEVVKAASCTETGEKTYSASVEFEGKTYTADKTEILEKIPHTAGEAVRENEIITGCTDPGSYDEIVYCTECGVELSRTNKTFDVLGHNFGAWTVTLAPTCTASGSMIRCCNRCDVNEVKAIPALGHDCLQQDAKAPTCTEAGWEAYDTCTRCDYTTYKEIPATGHSYVDGKCTVCGAADPDYKPDDPKPQQTNPFTDVSETAVYYDAILWAVENKITTGYADSTFRPGANCTRGQVVTFLWRAAGQPEPKGTCPFADVSYTSPYYKAIIWAAEKGITNGMDATHFAPNATVTRAQFVTFLWRYEGKPAASGTISFTDAAQIATPFKDAVAWAVGAGVTTGYPDGTFRPNATCTRWAVVLFMYRDLK